MIPRPIYLSRIGLFVGKPVIKVITGIRRCGKSAILALTAGYLRNLGISDEHIIRINFDEFENSRLTDIRELDRYVRERVRNDEQFYLLLDEIQNVPSWELAVRSFFTQGNIDIYITGSNSRLLSSELATHIAGRYVQIPVGTLTFGEYLAFRNIDTGTENLHAEFTRYLKMGGFPAVHTGGFTPETALSVVTDIYHSVYLVDVLERYSIRNVHLFQRILKYVFQNVGNLFSAKKIADYLKSQKQELNVNTVYRYISYMESAYLIHRVPRYSILGKELLQGQEKYFVSDISLIYTAFSRMDVLLAGILENVVYLELLSRGYQVYVGVIDNTEVDFIAERGSSRIYVQVCVQWTGSSDTLNRELTPLKKIPDFYPRFLVSTDELLPDNIDGIRCMHIADFLLSDAY